MHTFALCHSLVTIRLPNCLREIRAEVFVGCKALERLTLPGSIRYLGYRAFGDCTELFSLEYAWSSLLRFPSWDLVAILASLICKSSGIIAGAEVRGQE